MHSKLEKTKFSSFKVKKKLHFYFIYIYSFFSSIGYVLECKNIKLKKYICNNHSKSAILDDLKHKN